MQTGKLACEILRIMAELMNEKTRITGYEICQKLTGKEHDRKFIDLIRKLIALGIVERYDFIGRDEIGYYIRLSDIGKRTTSRIEDLEMRKYFIVAITIYCNQKNISSKELCEMLSKTDSFENKEENVMGIIRNFQGIFALEERSIMIEGTNKCKPAMEIDESAFYVFFKKWTYKEIPMVSFFIRNNFDWSIKKQDSWFKSPFYIFFLISFNILLNFQG